VYYVVEIGGRRRQVSVARTGPTFAVTVDGRTWHVDAARIDPDTLSLVLDNVWSKDAVIARNPLTGELTVRVDGTPVSVMVNGRRPLGGPPGKQEKHERDRVVRVGSPPSRERGGRLTAPMPGKVLRILVRPGEAVKSRQPLAVIEAMKMENELRALCDGVVAEVHATEGQSVDAGALLIVIQ
jgi:biotin carboxyl carrier protein